MMVSFRALTIAGTGTGWTEPPDKAGWTGLYASTCMSVVDRRKFGIIRFMKGVVLLSCMPWLEDWRKMGRIYIILFLRC